VRQQLERCIQKRNSATPRMNLTEFMARQNKPVLVCTGIALLAAMTLLDTASPPGFEASIFYLIPVSFFAWFLGRRPGLAASLICAGLALGIHRTVLSPYPSGLPYWNALAWLAAYVFFVYIIAEIRNLYAREQSWSHLDPLTRIPNRRWFFERLEIEKSRATRYDHPLTVAYIDLDHFKEVNDRFGHSTGDKLLGVAAQVMKDSVRREDAVARLGGDEFAVLFPNTEIVSASAAVTKLLSALNAAMEQHKWTVTFSIGHVTFQHPPESVGEMIIAADRAMYDVKKAGRGRLSIERPAT
jgi:diguanylate cyclase (GGDEF)-like protein